MPHLLLMQLRELLSQPCWSTEEMAEAVSRVEVQAAHVQQLLHDAQEQPGQWGGGGEGQGGACSVGSPPDLLHTQAPRAAPTQAQPALSQPLAPQQNLESIFASVGAGSLGEGRGVPRGGSPPFLQQAQHARQAQKQAQHVQREQLHTQQAQHVQQEQLHTQQAQHAPGPSGQNFDHAMWGGGGKGEGEGHGGPSDRLSGSGIPEGGCMGNGYMENCFVGKCM